MAVYVIAEIEVTDESWIPEYAAKAHEILMVSHDLLLHSASTSPIDVYEILLILKILQVFVMKYYKANYQK